MQRLMQPASLIIVAQHTPVVLVQELRNCTPLRVAQSRAGTKSGSANRRSSLNQPSIAVSRIGIQTGASA